jgi:hypothetical protein
MNDGEVINEGLRLLKRGVEVLARENPEEGRNLHTVIGALLKGLQDGERWREKAEMKLIELAAQKAEAAATLKWVSIPDDRLKPGEGHYMTVDSITGEITHESFEGGDGSMFFQHATDDFYIRLPLPPCPKASKQHERKKDENESKKKDSDPPF